jgi:hypothetical protein
VLQLAASFVNLQQAFYSTYLVHVMKTTQLLAFASSTLLTMSFSCAKQEAEEMALCDGTTTSVQGQDFALPLGCSFTAQRGEAKTYVINSVAELSAVTQCGSGATGAAVDFATYTLVAGQLPRPSGDVLRSQQMAQDCQGNYVYTLKVVDGPTLSPKDVPYGVLVPKFAAGKQVRLVVTTVQ